MSDAAQVESVESRLLCEVRHLNRDETWMLESVCNFHGLEV